MSFTLPLNPIINVIVNLASPVPERRDFSLALLIGTNTVIPQTERLRVYTSLDDMLRDGFLTSDRLYQAAQLLIGQALAPSRFLIGSIGTIEEDDGQGGTVTRAETPLEAVTACRQANFDWWAVTYCDTASDSDHIAITQYINNLGMGMSALYCYTSNDPSALTAMHTSIFAQIKALGYRRAFGQYSTKHQDAVCAVLGWAMGAMQDVPLEAYTLMFKAEVGVLPENYNSVFVQTSVDNIHGDNGNVYVNRGTYYNFFEDGRLADRTWFDELIFADKIGYDIQLAIADKLSSEKKVNQQETGVTAMIDVIAGVCQGLADSNIIASGIWRESNILNLKTGDALPNGYIIQSLPVSSQTTADRQARKAVPIFVSLNFSGAIHQITIAVTISK